MANDGRITNRGSLPSDEETAAFLHRLRPIYLNNEPTNFNRVANLVSVHLNDPWFTGLIRVCKRYYDGRASREVFEIAAGGMVIHPQEFLDHYLETKQKPTAPPRPAQVLSFLQNSSPWLRSRCGFCSSFLCQTPPKT